MGMISPQTSRRLQRIFMSLRRQSNDDSRSNTSQAIGRITGPGGTRIIDRAIPDLAGDVTGTIAANEVHGIIGSPLPTDSPTSGDAIVWVTDHWDFVPNGTGSVTAGHDIQDEGVPITQRDTLNFVGTGVTVTDDGTGHKTVVTIPGGGGGGTGTLAGDVTGESDANTVVRIQNIPVSATDPLLNQILIFDGTQWSIGTLPAAALATRWEPLTNGDPDDTQLMFEDGDVLMEEVPI